MYGVMSNRALRIYAFNLALLGPMTIPWKILKASLNQHFEIPKTLPDDDLFRSSTVARKPLSYIEDNDLQSADFIHPNMLTNLYMPSEKIGILGITSNQDFYMFTAARTTFIEKRHFKETADFHVTEKEDRYLAPPELQQLARQFSHAA